MSLIMIMIIITTIVVASIIKDVFDHVKMIYISMQHKLILIHHEAPSQLLLKETIQHSHISEK